MNASEDLDSDFEYLLISQLDILCLVIRLHTPMARIKSSSLTLIMSLTITANLQRYLGQKNI
jgi:hypothetical protein